MTDELDQRGRAAAAQVRARTARLDADRGLDAVTRRARRPRGATLLAVLVVALLAVPAVWWALGTDPQRLEFADDPPVIAPDAEAPEVEEAPEPAPQETAEPEEPPSAEEPEPLGDADTGEVTGEFPPADTLAYLTDVRVAGHDGFDRVVLEFGRGGTSPFRVTYIDPPVVSEGEGAEVEIAGQAYLEIRLLSATGVDFERGDPYELTYEGPVRLRADTSAVTEVVRTGDFEATLVWVVGVDRRAPFSVSVLSDPLRLVVDVQTE